MLSLLYNLTLFLLLLLFSFMLSKGVPLKVRSHVLCFSVFWSLQLEESYCAFSEIPEHH